MQRMTLEQAGSGHVSRAKNRIIDRARKTKEEAPLAAPMKKNKRSQLAPKRRKNLPDPDRGP